ncbi:hypothetical protein T03_2602 [Trichinella britovi]|uniref:Uncharacterized protein n=1 Tax=Trichinella britovi TaxID=45882 RepID=A0A0V1BKG0_TRIBR|nr:hypothetical protein T03_2602 [Trichinella britovi]
MLMAQRRRQTLLRHRWPGWKKVIVKAFRKAIQKNQTVESALTACTDPADILTIFNPLMDCWGRAHPRGFTFRRIRSIFNFMV